MLLSARLSSLIPLTSGGLLVSVTPETAEKILSDFQTEGLDTPYAVVEEFCRRRMSGCV